MAGITKNARQLRYARQAQAAKRAALALQAGRAIDPSLTVPLHLIEREGDDSEEGSWVPLAVARGQQSAPAAVHWDKECWESEESEEECEFTDGEDDEELEFNENAFQKLFTGAKNISGSEGLNLRARYQRGQHISVRTTASEEKST
jgi:hypothetical protein